MKYMKSQSEVALPAEKELAERVLAEQARLYFNQSPFVMYGAIAVMVITVAYFWPTKDHALLIGWLLASFTLTATRLAHAYQFRRHPRAGHEIQRWVWTAAAFALINGIIWGSVAILMMDPDDLGSVAFITVLLTGTVSGTAAANASLLPVFLGYAPTSLFALGTTMILTGDQLVLSLGFMVYAFFLANFGFVIHSNRQLKESLRLRFANSALIESLQEQTIQSERANRDKTRFLAAASHDLRQPVQALQLFIAGLEEEITEPKQLRIVERLRASQQAVQQMLDSLLDISRLDAGVLRTRIMPFSMADLFKRLEAEYTPVATDKGLSIRVHSTNAWVNSDPEQVSRIVQNLISNAIRYTNRGGVLVGCRRRGDKWSVEIWDSGRGIDADKHEEIFQEFYQVNNPSRDRTQGLGLGLAIVKRLADLLDCRLELQSRPGRGSVFRVYLPVAAPQSAPVSTPSGATPLPIRLQGRIVVVEDDLSVMTSLRELLQRWGLEVIAGCSYDEVSALLNAAAVEPDIILCDYNLGGVYSGIDVIKQIRSLSGDRIIPAIVLTGETGAEVRQLSEGITSHVLYKPVAPAKLRALIQSVLRAEHAALKRVNETQA